MSFSPFVSRRRHTISLMQQLSVSPSFAMLSKSGEYLHISLLSACSCTCSHLHESQNLANGGKTPYPGAGGRTPARGHATPGHMTSRGRTPNPYAGGVTPRPPPPGGVTPRPPPPPNAFPGGPAPPPNAFGAPPMPPAPGFNGGWGAVPPAPPGGMVPAGMNPQRAAMLQQAGGAGGWGGGGGGWGQ